MTSSSSTVSTSEAFRWATVIGAVPPSFTLKMSATNKQTGRRYQHSTFCFSPEWLKVRRSRVSSVGGWLSTGNTVMCRSYTGRVCLRWAVLLVLTGLPPLQHKASVSASPSEMTKVTVSWRGASPISTSETTNVIRTVRGAAASLPHLSNIYICELIIWQLGGRPQTGISRGWRSVFCFHGDSLDYSLLVIVSGFLFCVYVSVCMLPVIIALMWADLGMPPRVFTLFMLILMLLIFSSLLVSAFCCIPSSSLRLRYVSCYTFCVSGYCIRFGFPCLVSPDLLCI